RRGCRSRCASASAARSAPARARDGSRAPAARHKRARNRSVPAPRAAGIHVAGLVATSSGLFSQIVLARQQGRHAVAKHSRTFNDRPNCRYPMVFSPPWPVEALPETAGYPLLATSAPDFHATWLTPPIMDG